jgi:hypothetical protein
MGNVTCVDFSLSRRRFFAVRNKERYVTGAEQACLDMIYNRSAAVIKQGQEDDFFTKLHPGQSRRIHGSDQMSANYARENGRSYRPVPLVLSTTT